MGDAISGWRPVNVSHDVLSRKKRTDHRYHSGQDVPSLGTPHSISLSGMSQSCSKETQTPRSPKRISKFFRSVKSLAAGFDHSFSLSLISRRLVQISGVVFAAVFAGSASGTEAENEQLLGFWKSEENCFVHIYQTQDSLLLGAAWQDGKGSGELFLEVGDDRRFPWKRKTKKTGFADDGERDPKTQGRFIVDLFDRSILYSNSSPCFLKTGAAPRWSRVEIGSIEPEKVPEWYRPALVGSITQGKNQIQKSQSTKSVETNQPNSSGGQVAGEVQKAEGLDQQLTQQVAQKASMPGCIDLISTEVENKEFIEKGIKYRDLKKAVVQQNLIDAVQQVLGTEVRSHSGMALSSVDGTDSERFNELVAQRANGLVKSYEVTTEEIIGTGDTKLLTVGLRVVVCVPDETTTFDMVAVGDFILSNGSNSERLRSILIDLFPDHLSDYRLIPGHPRHAYHDVQIVGKVLRAGKTDESYIMAEQKKSQEQAAAQIAGGLIGAFTGLGGLGSLAASMNAGPAMRTYQVTVEVEVTARRIMDQQVVSDRSVLTKANLPEDIDFFAVRDELLAVAAEQATQSIYQKVFGVAGGSASTKRESSSLGSLFGSTDPSISTGGKTEDELLNER